MGRGAKHNQDFCLILREILESVNLPKVRGMRSQAWPMFYLTLRKIMGSINLPKACGPRSQA